MPLSRIRHCRFPAAGHTRGARRITALLLSGLLLEFTPGATVLAQGVTLAAHTEPVPYAAHVAEASQRFAIPEHWIRAVMRVESAGDPRAVSSAGAIGLMQVMPETWAELRRRHRLGSDAFAPRDNILAGAAYLREMLDRYGKTGATLAAYNAGPARYDDYLASGRALPAETRAYVATLVPLLDGNAPLAAAARPVDWRDAALFVGIDDAGSVQLDGTSAATITSPDGLVRSSASGMFVARDGEGGAK